MFSSVCCESKIGRNCYVFLSWKMSPYFSKRETSHLPNFLGHRGGNCCAIKDKDTRHKLFWSGNDKGTAGVGVFVAEEWIEKVFKVQRVSNRIILVKLIVGQRVVTFLSVYAPQSGVPVCICPTEWSK